MVLVNYSTKEIVAKIVYYGPGLCGKTTNLQYVYTKLNPKKRGKIISLATEADRTLFFDFLPVELGVVQGFRVRFQLYTVPGQVFYSATRKLVLKGTDAVVFVADSQADVLGKNIESIEDMKQNLMENGIDPSSIPIAFQYNKRDLENVLDVGLLDKKLNFRQAPWFEASAVRGDGVMETFKEVTRLLIKDLKQKHSMMDSDMIQELPPEVFEQKAKPAKPEEAPRELVIEMGSSIREDASGADVEAGSLLDKVETIALADTVQAEVFFDNVRKGEPAEEARQKALEAQEPAKGPTAFPHAGRDMASVADERELSPEELENAEALPVLDDIEAPEVPAAVEDVPDWPDPRGTAETEAVIMAIERLEKEVQSLSSEVARMRMRTKDELPGTGGMAVIAARVDGLEKRLKEAAEGQDRLLLSILEAVRDSRNSNSTAHEKMEDDLRTLVERAANEPKKRRWF
jgi:signal recognition particle receptor subunit beta